MNNNQKRYIDENYREMSSVRLSDELGVAYSKIRTYVKKKGYSKPQVGGLTEEQKKFILDNKDILTRKELSYALKVEYHRITYFVRTRDLAVTGIKAPLDMDKVLKNIHLPLSELTEVMGVSRGKVIKFCKDNDLEVNVREITPITEEEGMYLKANTNLTLTQASKLMGHSCHKISRYCKNNGIVLHKRIPEERDNVNELTDEQVSYVTRNHTNMTATQLATELGLDYQVMKRYVKVNKLKVKPETEINAARGQWLDENSSSMGLATLSREMEITEAEVMHHLLERGLKYLTRGRYNLINEEVVRDNVHLTNIQLAKQEGYNRDSLKEFCKDRHIKLKEVRKWMTPEQKQFILDNADKYTLTEMSLKLDLKRPTVCKHCIRNGITLKK